MRWPEDVHIEQVIGPRLERGAVVIETLTPMGRIGLRVSASAASGLIRALQVAVGEGLPELPAFLTADPDASTESRRRRRPRKLLRNSDRSRSAA